MLESIETFKPGRHQASNGQVFEFTADQVAEIAASYDPAIAAAPIVLGHPKNDDPAWGWAEKVTVNDKGVLVVTPEKIDPAFAEGVEAGRYRYVSAALYAPDDSRNPKPGTWYLRHIGFLGAQPPAVKGLRPAFSDDQGDVLEFSMADGFWVRDIFRSMRDWMIEKFGLDVADRVVPSWSVDNVEKPEPSPAVAEQPDFSAGEAGAVIEAAGQEADELAARAAALSAREAALAEREQQAAQRDAQFSEAARAEARAEDVTFVEGLLTEGRLPPGHRDRVLALFARLDGDASVTFAEPNASGRAELHALLSGLGVSISFAEASPASETFDPTSADSAPEIARRIGEIRAQAASEGRQISFSEAAARLAD